MALNDNLSSTNSLLMEAEEKLDSKRIRRGAGEKYNPYTTAEMNYFAFETEVRNKIKVLVTPLIN